MITYEREDRKRVKKIENKDHKKMTQNRKQTKTKI